MDTMFMNSENSTTYEPHASVFTDKLDLRKNKKNMKNWYNNNKSTISPPTWNDKSELTDGPQSVLDIQDYVEYILKRHNKKIDNPSTIIHVNKIENRVTFEIKIGYYLELLTPETMKLLESTEKKITKDKNGENMSHIEVTEVVLVHCDIVNNDYQQVLYTLIY